MCKGPDNKCFQSSMTQVSRAQVADRVACQQACVAMCQLIFAPKLYRAAVCWRVVSFSGFLRKFLQRRGLLLQCPDLSRPRLSYTWRVLWFWGAVLYQEGKPSLPVSLDTTGCGFCLILLHWIRSWGSSTHSDSIAQWYQCQAIGLWSRSVVTVNKCSFSKAQLGWKLNIECSDSS